MMLPMTLTQICDADLGDMLSIGRTQLGHMPGKKDVETRLSLAPVSKTLSVRLDIFEAIITLSGP